MLKFIRLVFILSLCVTAGEIDPNLQSHIDLNPEQDVTVWIFFRDKGPQEKLSFSKEYGRISEKALQRRSKMSGEIIKFSDYPVYPDYLDQIKDYHVKIRRQSRWLNAVSAVVQAQKINLLASLDFISEICMMAVHNRPAEKTDDLTFDKMFVTPSDSQFYGRSLAQLQQTGIFGMQQLGFTGKGVTIAMLDDGFNQVDRHICFDSLDVTDAYDFVNDDNDITDRDSIPRQGWHGTQTLSVVAGYTPGELIGAAYKAAFLLAKTEINAREIKQEEDNWVAGLEWAEARGADIVSSSVGYIDWYTWRDMDGQTAITTRATNIAESKGLIVVCAAGNEGAKDAPNTLTAPADGTFVITVGGAGSTGNYLAFSSYGPSADGRIKPDVSALATNVYRASDSGAENFLYGTGTSLAAPLVSGAIALLLEAAPQLTPQEVREALKKTASQAATPDNFLGYGIMDIYGAYQYVLNDTLPVKPIVEKAVNAPNPFSIYTRIEYAVKSPSVVSITVFDVSGREVLHLPEKIINGNNYEIITGNQLGANGIYFYVIRGREFGSGKRLSKYGKLLFFK